MNMPQGRINLNEAIIRNKKRQKQIEKFRWFAIGLLAVSLISYFVLI
jgi:hypothetical protein